MLGISLSVASNKQHASTRMTFNIESHYTRFADDTKLGHVYNMRNHVSFT